jgi:hypothetical protein
MCGIVDNIKIIAKYLNKILIKYLLKIGIYILAQL